MCRKTSSMLSFITLNQHEPTEILINFSSPLHSATNNVLTIRDEKFNRRHCRLDIKSDCVEFHTASSALYTSKSVLRLYEVFAREF